MDRGDDSHHMRTSLQAHAMIPVIPPKNNRKAPMADDEAQDKLRAKVERFFNRFKPFRRMATRDDKPRQCFLAFLPLTAVW